jgi:hypothetical protein
MLGSDGEVYDLEQPQQQGYSDDMIWIRFPPASASDLPEGIQTVRSKLFSVLQPTDSD